MVQHSVTVTMSPRNVILKEQSKPSNSGYSMKHVLKLQIRKGVGTTKLYKKHPE